MQTAYLAGITDREQVRAQTPNLLPPLPALQPAFLFLLSSLLPSHPLYYLPTFQQKRITFVLDFSA